MYWMTSPKRDLLFFLTMFFSVLTNMFFVSKGKEFLFYALIVFTLHRIFLLYFVFLLLKIRDFIPIMIGFLPFFFLFSYIFKFGDEVPQHMYAIIVVQNVLISLFGGIALSNYIMNDNSKNSWLYLSGLLFVLLQLVVFIEKYYLYIAIFRPIAMFLNICAFYCFYRFVLSMENSNNNSLA